MNRMIDKIFVCVLLFCGLLATLVGATPVVTPKYGSGSLPVGTIDFVPVVSTHRLCREK